METMAHSVRWRIISEQDTNGFSKLFVCLLKGISTVLPVKPLQFDVAKPPVVDPKIVFFPWLFPWLSASARCTVSRTGLSGPLMPGSESPSAAGRSEMK